MRVHERVVEGQLDDCALTLRDLREIPRPEPTGLATELRHYQLDGFHWLAFLHEQGLGGILADAVSITAAIWTEDAGAAQHIGDEIATGTVFMNRCDYLDPALAWTGVKDSGRGMRVLGARKVAPLSCTSWPSPRPLPLGSSQ